MTSWHHTVGLTNRQHNSIEKFLNLLADVESALKARLKRRTNVPTCVRTLFDEYAARNPYWTDFANQLRNLADNRNLLTHQRRTARSYPR